jgi:opacity protein-like surface antigen
MYKLSFSVAASVLITANYAYAADLTVVDPMIPPPAAEAAPAPFNWTGFYIGAQGGGAFVDRDGVGCSDSFLENFDVDAGITRDNARRAAAPVYPEIECDDFTTDDRGGGDDETFVLGGHIGADAQFGAFVFGALVDGNWIDADGGRSSFSLDPDAIHTDPRYVPGPYPGFPGFVFHTVQPRDGSPGTRLAESGVPNQFFSFESELEWYGTGRLRAGVAPGGGRFLIFATGGVAFGDTVSRAEHVAIFTPDEADGFFGGGAAQGGEAGGQYDPNDPRDEAGLPDHCVEGPVPTVEVRGGDTGVTCTIGSKDSEFLFGFAAGLGAEVLVTRHLSFGAEYLYVDLGSPDFDPFDTSFDDFDFHTFMAKASIRFGG